MACSNCTLSEYTDWEIRVAEIDVRIAEIDVEISELYTERSNLQNEKGQLTGYISQCDMQGGPP